MAKAQQLLFRQGAQARNLNLINLITPIQIVVTLIQINAKLKIRTIVNKNKREKVTK